MSTKIGKKTSYKQKVRFKHKKRIRSIVSGTADRPRLAVFRSNSNMYVQVVDDTKGHTLASASTVEEENRGKLKSNIDGAKNLGNLIAKRAQAKNISNVVFDRSGYAFHGRIKAVADAAREGGLKF